MATRCGHVDGTALMRRSPEEGCVRSWLRLRTGRARQAEQFSTGHSLIYVYADPNVTRLVYWTRVIGLTHPIVTLRMPISSFWIGHTLLYRTQNIYRVASPANSSSSVGRWFTKHLIPYSRSVQIFSAAVPSAPFLHLFSPSTWNASSFLLIQHSTCWDGLKEGSKLVDIS